MRFSLFTLLIKAGKTGPLWLIASGAGDGAGQAPIILRRSVRRG
ncbi:hypothetical protein ACFOGG_04590 [Brenneria rubrifaciens]